LVGGVGNDLIQGGEGQDAMRGNDGADIFVIEKPQSIPDLILDLDIAEGDQIVIDPAGFNNTDQLTDFQFLGGYLYYKEEKLALIQNDGQTYNYFADLSEVVKLASTENLASLPMTETQTEIRSAGIPSTRSFGNEPETRKGKETPKNLLEEILQRGYIKVGVIPGRYGFSLEENGEWSGYGVDWAKGLSSALFGKPDQIEIIPSTSTSSNAVLATVANKEVDIVATNINPTMARDAGMDVDFAPTSIYDSRAVMVRKDSNIDSVSDLKGLTVGLTANSSGAQNFDDFMVSHEIDYVAKYFKTGEEMYAAYATGEVDAVPADRTTLISIMKTMPDTDNHLVLDEELSKEPIALVVPENESAWADLVRWVTYAPIQAEEFGINSQNIEEFKASKDPAIRRFLGVEGTLGETLGLSNPNFTEDVIKTVGNYGEIFERHFPDLKRNRNEIWTNEGLLYSPPFAGTVINDTPLEDNDNRDLLGEINKRGYVKIGVSGTSPGFSLNKDGEWSGIDVDLGRALAAAVFGNSSKIEFVTQSFREGFAKVANGETDVSAMGITQNLMRDAGMG
ncbi:MAG: transporter substrate-binding domain-containing protein, partial [Microcoleaceae cyanobacterium]